MSLSSLLFRRAHRRNPSMPAPESTHTGADQVADALQTLGVRHVFAIASIHNLPILRALHRRGFTEIVGMRHEQAAVHAADAYARSGGGLGVAIASTGPGTANTMGGLYEASFANSRVLLITGQTETYNLDKGKGALHEAEHQPEMLRSLCREVARPRRGGDIGDILLRLARDVLTGRPQPAAVEIPIDMQRGPCEQIELKPLEVPRDGVPDEHARRAAELLASAERPLIYAGAGVNTSGAGPQLLALAEATGIPVVTSRDGRGAIPEDHPQCLGGFATVRPLREYVESADVVLAVGARFQMLPTDAWRLRMPENLIHLDVDPTVIGRTYKAKLALAGDAARGLEQIHAHLGSPARDHAEHLARGREAMAAARQGISAEMGPDHEAICASIRRHLPRRSPVVRDATVPAYVYGDRVLPVYEPGSSIRPVGAAIGPGLPFAIGAATVTGLPTVLIQGDGGFMLSVGELASAAQAGAKVIVCLFNDKGYGVLREILERQYGPPQDDVDLVAPDFEALARSFGIAAEKVADTAAFDAAFARAVEHDGPSLIEIDMSALHPLQRA
ncbi:MAG: thiamine pyrophosphate-binding protein [Streptosporangiales bacterium]|nr:thiamine pyrophosphate-binding protein [Streptosporangiales bacterium]